MPPLRQLGEIDFPKDRELSHLAHRIGREQARPAAGKRESEVISIALMLMGNVRKDADRLVVLHLGRTTKCQCTLRPALKRTAVFPRERPDGRSLAFSF